MRHVLTLSLAALLVSSTVVADMAIDQFLQDPEIVKVAPHLIHEIQVEGIETTPAHNVVKETTDVSVPFLDDLVEIIAVNFFQLGSQDWSNLEKARQKAIELHGDENVKKWANISEMDTRHAAAIINTVYDTVIQIPTVTANTHKANKEATNTGKVWDLLGASLVKTADYFKKAKGIVVPTAVCVTDDVDYIKGVEDVVYYSSLTHGLAGGILVAAPSTSAAKSIELKDIVEAAGKLSIEIQMAQNIARLSGLKPEDDPVRLMTFLGLAAVNSNSKLALTARDIHALTKQGLDKRIPPAVITSLSNQAAIILITRGAGEQGNTLSAENVPILRNVVAFSSDVLTTNNIGDTLKYVFCPETNDDEQNSSTTVKDKVENVAEDVEKKAENIVNEAGDKGQKVLKAAKDKSAEAQGAVKETAEKVSSEGTKLAREAKKKTESAAEDAKEKVVEAKDSTTDKLAATKEQVEKKGADASAGVKGAAKKVVEDVKHGAEEAGAKIHEATKKAAAEAKKAADKAKEAVVGAGKKVKNTEGDVHQEL